MPISTQGWADRYYQVRNLPTSQCYGVDKFNVSSKVHFSTYNWQINKELLTSTSLTPSIINNSRHKIVYELPLYQFNSYFINLIANPREIFWYCFVQICYQRPFINNDLGVGKLEGGHNFLGIFLSGGGSLF